MAHEFETLNQAASALLVETCGLPNERQLGYVVASGWVPVLRSIDPDIVHPGTRDVDVLFNDDRQAIRNAVECMLKNGFILSAKHKFQLLRTLRVASREIVFNVDLMHPLEASANSEMFQDILELEIRSDYDENRPKVKSICFPSSATVSAAHALRSRREVFFKTFPFEADHLGLVVVSFKLPVSCAGSDQDAARRFADTSAVRGGSLFCRYRFPLPGSITTFP